MIIDHRNGRSRHVYEVGDIVKFALRNSSEVELGNGKYVTATKIKDFASFAKKLQDNKPIEASDGDVVIINEVIPFEAEITVVAVKLFDTRITTLPDINRYVIRYIDKEFYVPEFYIR